MSFGARPSRARPIARGEDADRVGDHDKQVDRRKAHAGSSPQEFGRTSKRGTAAVYGEAHAFVCACCVCLAPVPAWRWGDDVMDRATGIEKPRQSLAGLWNISFGFFGIQIGFALQNANMCRIFQSLGSSLDDLPALWVAAPLTGLLVQPIIGHMCDRTWLGRLGRRRPYFVPGAILAALSAALDAARPGPAVRGDPAVDARCQPQYLDGAVPRLRRRHAAQGPAHRRLCGADRLHRRRRGARLAVPAGCSRCGACRTSRPAAASPTRSATPSGSAARRCSWRCCGRSSPPRNIRPRK